MRLRSAFLSFATIALVCGATYAQNAFYAEIESEDAVSPWQLKTSTAGYDGTGYFFWSGGDVMSGAKQGVITYTFSVESAGQYIVDFRGRRDHSGICAGAANDLCNDIFVQLNNGTWEKHMIKIMGWDAWGWDQNADIDNKVSQHLEDLNAGTNTISIAGRSKGVSLDAVRVYKKGTPKPTEPTTGGGVTRIIDRSTMSRTAVSAQMSNAVYYSVNGSRLGTAADLQAGKLSGIMIQRIGTRAMKTVVTDR